jgi:hypothetical protein
MFRVLLLLLTFPVIANAQITLDVKPGRAVTKLVEPVLFGDTVIHFGESEQTVPAAYITLGSKYKYNLLRAYKATGGRGSLEKLDDTHWVLRGEGTYEVEATGIEPGIDEKIVTVTLGPTKPEPEPEPEPDPKPTPDVPEDAFNNIGQRVATWTKDLAGRDKIGAVYLSAAKSLRNDPSQTINSITANMSQQLLGIQEYLTYKQFTQQLNADINSRWPLTRGVYADYLTCVALGMGVK